MSEEIIIKFAEQTGFRISKCDLTTGKIVVNGIEITSVEDWEKVTKSLVELQQENQQLKQILDEIREYIEDEDFYECSYEDIYHNVREILDKVKE